MPLAAVSLRFVLPVCRRTDRQGCWSTDTRLPPTPPNFSPAIYRCMFGGTRWVYGRWTVLLVVVLIRFWPGRGCTVRRRQPRLSVYSFGAHCAGAEPRHGGGVCVCVCVCVCVNTFMFGYLRLGSAVARAAEIPSACLSTCLCGNDCR